MIILLITYLISILAMSVIQILQQRFLDPPILAKIQYIFFIYTSFLNINIYLCLLL